MIRIPGNARFDDGVHDRPHFVQASDQRDFFELPPGYQPVIKSLDDGVVTYGT